MKKLFYILILTKFISADFTLRSATVYAHEEVVQCLANCISPEEAPSSLTGAALGLGLTVTAGAMAFNHFANYDQSLSKQADSLLIHLRNNANLPVKRQESYKIKIKNFHNSYLANYDLDSSKIELSEIADDLYERVLTTYWGFVHSGLYGNNFGEILEMVEDDYFYRLITKVYDFECKNGNIAKGLTGIVDLTLQPIVNDALYPLKKNLGYSYAKSLYKVNKRKSLAAFENAILNGSISSETSKYDIFRFFLELQKDSIDKLIVHCVQLRKSLLAVARGAIADSSIGAILEEEQMNYYINKFTFALIEQNTSRGSLDDICYQLAAEICRDFPLHERVRSGDTIGSKFMASSREYKKDFIRELDKISNRYNSYARSAIFEAIQGGFIHDGMSRKRREYVMAMVSFDALKYKIKEMDDYVRYNSRQWF